MQTKEEKAAYNKEYHLLNKRKIAADRREYYLVNKEKFKEANKIINARHCEKNNPITNAKRMTVNGKYVSRKHPLWKIGNYKSFNDAAFSSFVNYSKSTDGYVYAIKNKAWPEWVKIGKAGDAEDRLKNYQTGDPFRAYTLEFSFKVTNRHTAETEAHKALALLSEDRRNEWFKVDLETAQKCIEAVNV